MPKSEIGQRGKSAEKKVQKHLDALNVKHEDFAYSRQPDARAAGGRMAAALCDFLVWYKGKSIPLEVKQIKTGKRLPKASLSQLANLKKVAMAGAMPHVLVHLATLDQWVIAPIRFFEFGVPSWDLTHLKLHNTVEDAVASILFDVF